MRVCILCLFPSALLTALCSLYNWGPRVQIFFLVEIRAHKKPSAYLNKSWNKFSYVQLEPQFLEHLIQPCLGVSWSFQARLGQTIPMVTHIQAPSLYRTKIKRKLSSLTFQASLWCRMREISPILSLTSEPNWSPSWWWLLTWRTSWLVHIHLGDIVIKGVNQVPTPVRIRICTLQ